MKKWVSISIIAFLWTSLLKTFKKDVYEEQKLFIFSSDNHTIKEKANMKKPFTNGIFKYNIFEGIADNLIYLLIYDIIPVFLLIINFVTKSDTPSENTYFYFAVLISVGGGLYDTFGKYKHAKHNSIRKLLIIRATPYTIIFLYSVLSCICVMATNGNTLGLDCVLYVCAISIAVDIAELISNIIDSVSVEGGDKPLNK